MNQDAEVTVEYQNRVAIVRLNRPGRLNAWNNKISAGLDAASTSGRSSGWSVIITGNGRAFCAGVTFQVAAIRSIPIGLALAMERERTPQFLPIDVTKPVIAASTARLLEWEQRTHCCAIFELPHRVRIGFVFNRIGMLPELGSHSLLPRIVGFSNAAQLLMGGEIIDANTALSMSLVSQVYPDEDLLDQAIAC